MATSDALAQDVSLFNPKYPFPKFANPYISYISAENKLGTLGRIIKDFGLKKTKYSIRHNLELLLEVVILGKS